jgi:hypothetical protein
MAVDIERARLDLQMYEVQARGSYDLNAQLAITQARLLCDILEQLQHTNWQLGAIHENIRNR